VGKNDKKIRVFKNGVGFLATQTQAMVLPVWVEGTDMVAPNRNLARYPILLRLWKPVSITIGRPIIFTADVSAEQATGEIEKVVLDL
jgi:1-acyl-sn-glycerol-3-phosphate acyltransferase